MKTYLTLFLWVFTMLLRCLPMAAQCAEVEEVLKDIVTKEINTKVVNHNYDTFERVACYNLEGINEDDFILLGRGLEYSDITKKGPNTVEYNVIRMIDKKMVWHANIFLSEKKRQVSQTIKISTSSKNKEY